MKSSILCYSWSLTGYIAFRYLFFVNLLAALNLANVFKNKKTFEKLKNVKNVKNMTKIKKRKKRVLHL